MRVRDIMSSPAIGVTAEAGIDEAAALMMDRGFTTLPVFTSTGHLLGLLTEADVGGARYAHAATAPEDGAITGVNPRLARQVMRAPALAVTADADLAELATVMVDSHQRCLPVVDAGKVVGMVSWRDLLARLAEAWHTSTR